MAGAISPFDLAKQPFRLEGEMGEYDHSLQRTVGSSVPMGSYQTNTFGGTQTFGFNGQPQTGYINFTKRKSLILIIYTLV